MSDNKVVTDMDKWQRGLRFCDYLETPEVSRGWKFTSILSGSLWDYVLKHNTAEGYCGTIGCAIGHLPFWEESKADGWQIRIDHASVRVVTPYNERHDSYTFIDEDAAHYFGINVYQASNIFMNITSYNIESIEEITPSLVAERLRRILLKYIHQAGVV